MERNIEEMISNPPRYFSHPTEVLNEPISTKDKRKILESWKLDAQRLAESTAENMSGGEEEDLRAVNKTLIQLNTAEPATKPMPVTQQPQGVRRGLGIGAIAGLGVALIFLTASNGFTAAAREGWMTPIAVLVEATIAGALVGGIIAAIRTVSRP